MRWMTTLLLTALVLFTTSSAQADDEKLPLDKVPSAVKESVKKRFPNAEIVGAAKETENGKVTFELNLKDQGQNIDVIVTSEGTIETIEKEIAAKDLPKVVADAVATKYPKATYKKYEQVFKIKDGKETLEYYEVVINTGDKKDLEVEITPEGKIKD
jgi:Putative beta-lactamase-inhibitor-like, PepSY-like